MALGAAPHEKKAGLAYWAQRALAECDKASQDFAADPVHDLRVAIRRCRSMADGFLSVDPDPQWKQMKKLGKSLFSSLGELRDTQVMMEWVTKLSGDHDPVRHKLLHALAQKETAQKAAAQEALRDFDRKRWLELNTNLAKRTGKVPLEGLVFQHLALERWLDARALHRQALKNRTQVGYHQLRIGIKRFRYTVENFLPQRHAKWAPDLRDLQDALGEVHDLDVLRATIRAQDDINPQDATRWQHRIAEERQKRLDLYRNKMLGKNSLWGVWRAELPSGPALEAAALDKLRTWASFLDPDPAHSYRVTRFALQLYDALSRHGVLSGRPEYRRILQAAAILHDVGRKKSATGHPKRSYRMIYKLKPPLGWSEEELHCVATVARYHRGALPQKSQSYFVGLSARRRSGLLPVIGILRLANAFDSAHDGKVTRISVEQRDETMTISGQGLEEISATAERLAQARYLLEVVSGVNVRIRSLIAKPATSSRVARRSAQVAAGS
jgi:exopolyphosphatase/guanosine-5'-triphosphate,3'-diphosphate pyrophosphatase